MSDSDRVPLTEMEGAALGNVIRDGPITSYAVKELFRTSPSEFWSGSAGAIYPLMQRLEKKGLIQAQKSITGRRKSKTYVSTPLGQRVFRQWLTDPERAVAMGFDPLRTRLVFFNQLTPEERNHFRTEFNAALGNLQPFGGNTILNALHDHWNHARSGVLDRYYSLLEHED